MKEGGDICSFINGLYVLVYFADVTNKQVAVFNLSRMLQMLKQPKTVMLLSVKTVSGKQITVMFDSLIMLRI